MNSTRAIFLISAMLASFLSSYSQQTEYRISHEGKYQYLSNRQEVGMVFDESLGTFYKNITVRTFFLETQRKGFIPSDITYEQFVKMDKEDQKTILKQPHEDLDCSSNNISMECLSFEKKTELSNSNDVKVIDLSPKCVDINNETSLSTKTVVNPNDDGIVNNDCKAAKFAHYTAPPASKDEKIKAMRALVGNK